MYIAYQLQSIWDETSRGSDSFSKSSLYKIQPNFTSYGSFTSGDQKDYYAITPGIGDFKLVVTSDPLNGFDSSAYSYEFVIKIIDSSGNVILTSDASGPDLYSDSITFNSSLSNQSFYVEITNSLYGDFSYAATLMNLSVIPVGTAGNDDLNGGFGNDSIYGGAGEDSIDGGSGNDYIDGGIDGDRLSGEMGNDTVYGDTGNDLIWGEAGDDYLDGGADIDVVGYTFASSSVIVNLALGTATGEGNDTLINIEGVFGSNFDDYLSGDIGDNIFQGSDGNDTLVGGAGLDSVIYSKDSSVTVNLAVGTSTGEGEDTLISIEDVIGSNYSDTLIGNTENNRLWGGNGDDNLWGGTGNDYLSGDADKDQLAGGAGNDTLDGGEGVDSLAYIQATSAVTVNLSRGTATGGEGNDTITNIENIFGSDYADTLIGNYESNDLIGGTGADKLIGGLGNDAYSVDNAADVVTEQLNQGIDTVYSSISYTLKNNLENLRLVGTAAINGTGNTLGNILNGNISTNKLNGGSGIDILNGGLGADYLTGGKGADYFSFGDIADSGIITSAMDTITDFARNEHDKISMIGLDANSILAGDQTFSFIGANIFTAAGQLRFDPATHILSGNTDNYIGAEFAVLLLGVSSLLASDFYFI